MIIMILTTTCNVEDDNDNISGCCATMAVPMQPKKVITRIFKFRVKKNYNNKKDTADIFLLNKSFYK